MDEKRDDKEFKEAVEKVINEHEERKRASMGKSQSPIPIEKKNLVKETPSLVKKNKGKHVKTVLVIIIIAVFLTWMFWPSIMMEEEPIVVYPANVVLASFYDGDNTFDGYLWPGMEVEIQPGYVCVSFELKNTGDEDAMDVSCFIRCCDQNGTILFAQLFTFGDIWPDTPGKISESSSYRVPIPATASYKVPISDEVMYVTHSIDVRWSPQGVNTYVKLTEV